MSGRTRRLSTTLLGSVLVYAALILACFACIFSAFFYFTQEGDEERNLEAMAQRAAAALDCKNAEEAATILDAQLTDGVRYTLINRDGDVIFDSAGVAHENHADRPEVKEARNAGTSSVIRYSTTLKRDTIYAAATLSSGNVLRLAEERPSFVSVLESMAPALLLALVVALLLSIALSRALSRRVVRPLGMIDVANPLENETYEEMRPLLTRIDAQQQQLKNQNRELERAEGMRRDFSTNVSHEMKTPLQVISGYAELLAQGNIPDDGARHFGQIIFDESSNLTALIDDVLVLSRIDDPVMENAGKERVELLELSHEVVKRLEPLASRRSVNVRCFGSTVEVEGNRGLLTQLISNLVSNAIRYNEADNEVVVTVGKSLATPGTDDVTEAVLKVRDSGCGIPEAEQEKIFERFYRVDKSRSKESGGTGLGLAIAKNAAAFHDASISVKSDVGHGSVFTVRIPTSL